MSVHVLRPADVRAADREVLRVRLEELAECWQARFFGDADVRVVLAALRPDLPPAEVWDLWLNFAAAVDEWRSASGWAGNLHKAAIKMCDELTGGAV